MRTGGGAGYCGYCGYVTVCGEAATSICYAASLLPLDIFTVFTPLMMVQKSTAVFQRDFLCGTEMSWGLSR